jgi:acyl carrier protein
MDISDKLGKVFCDIFDDDELCIEADMTANDVPGWDSLSHVMLISAIESEFRVHFSQRELLSFKKVGDLKLCLESKG